MNKKRVIIIVVVLAAITLLAIPKLTSKKEGDAKGKGQMNAPVTVDVMVIKYEGLLQDFQTKGTLLANEQVEIRAEVAGKVTAINFTEGQLCRKGQLLVKINDDELRSTLKKLELNAKLSKEMMDRQKNLFDKGGISKSDLDKAVNEYESLLEEIAKNKAQLEKMTIIAPMDGRIGLREISVGSYVSASTLITSLVNSDPIKVEFSVPEKYAYKVKENSHINFTIAGDTSNYKATVYATDALIDDATRTLRIRAITKNPKNKLLAGSFANVKIELANKENTIKIPTQAIVPILKGQKVFVVKNGKATEVIVKTGFRNDAEIEITEGLAVGDTLIVNGVVQVKQGSLIKVNKKI